jgi:steroid delta-isomerase-like uncharacterized protein
MPELAPRNAATLQAHVAAETAFDMAATLATLTLDCVFEDMPTGRTHHGHEGVRAYYEAWWRAFGNVPERGRLYVVSPDRLVVETHFVGTHRGEYEGVAATGRAIDLPVAIFVQFKDGLMHGERFYYDRATLLRQIGAA